MQFHQPPADPQPEARPGRTPHRPPEELGEHLRQVDRGDPFTVVADGDRHCGPGDGPLDQEASQRTVLAGILHQVGDALTYLHSKGIVHRDLKPENILMPTESLAKVGDFGIAVLKDKVGVLPESLLGMGTVGYVAPEQQYGLKVDDRADQYSLAALSYELLTGRPPFQGQTPPKTRCAPNVSRVLGDGPRDSVLVFARST